MLGPVGDQMLRMLGREPAPQGIIEVAAMPAAIAALEQAIAAAERARARRATTDDDDEAGGATAVGLRQRAWPLLEMMKRSLAGAPTSSGASEPAGAAPSTAARTR